MIENAQVAGISKSLSIARVIGLAVGRKIFMSKRLAPPMTICNARVFAGNDLVFTSDIEIPKYTKVLLEIAEEFETVITICQESSNQPVWSSATPSMWLGYAGEKATPPISIFDAFPFYEEVHRKRVRQWQIDHGVIRRNFKEWYADVYWSIKWGAQHKLIRLKKRFSKQLDS